MKRRYLKYSFLKYTAEWERVFLYITGLMCTCFGVGVVLKTNWGLDAWNGVFAGLENITSLSIGVWSMIIQGSFWILSAILNKKVDWLCLFPIVLKGIFLDMAKAIISFAGAPFGIFMNGIFFLSGYALVAAGTGAYVATGYPKMPIDGLMTAISSYFSWSIKRARLVIELCGFTFLLLVRGPFGFGTVIITFTIGSVITVSQKFAKKWILKEE